MFARTQPTDPSKDRGPIRELRDLVRQAHSECLHKYDPPQRRAVEIDFSRIPGHDPTKKSYITYIEQRCSKCPMELRYPVISICTQCGSPMLKAGAKPPGWRRERRDAFETIEPEAYQCRNNDCKATIIVVDALYEPPEEDLEQTS
ncbi:MAG TPA: hypothetical protein VEB18_01485 [Candidatus Paceibacterota bacterium]|nr:hypothetical protein [Candidatus Paceibacterota bacterium]